MDVCLESQQTSLKSIVTMSECFAKKWIFMSTKRWVLRQRPYAEILTGLISQVLLTLQQHRITFLYLSILSAILVRQWQLEARKYLRSRFFQNKIILLQCTLAFTVQTFLLLSSSGCLWHRGKIKHLTWETLTSTTHNYDYTCCQ